MMESQENRGELANIIAHIVYHIFLFVSGNQVPLMYFQLFVQ